MTADKISALVVCLAASAFWFAAAQQTSGTSTNNTHQLTSWERINRAADDVKSGDPGPIGVLVDEVFAHHGIGQSMIAIYPSMKDRLATAEMDYHTNMRGGLTEDSVVATVNDLARRFNAPPYAYTTASEVKRVRLRMLTLYPKLMGRGPASTRDDSKPHIENRMSPVEAFHVTATLLHQKVFNPSFQFSRQELQTVESSETRSDESMYAKGNSNGERTREMLGIVYHGLASMSDTEMLDQSRRSLDLLGIRR